MKRISGLLALFGLAGLAHPALADVTATSAVARSQAYGQWSQAYEQSGGDRNAVVGLSAVEELATERSAAHGSVRLDLIQGKVTIELEDLDSAVDVYLLDNIPGAGKSLLPEQGDRLVHLARLQPDRSKQARVTRSLGPAAFRGLELDWIFVARAGQEPSKSRLLAGTRHYFERLYTRQRLAREGYEVAAERPQAASLQSADLGVLATQPSQILVTSGLVSQAVYDGASIFFRETFEGNGRSCGSCHPAENNQTIDADFIATLPATDPLFVAEQRPSTDPISKLERPALMRVFGLILENVDGLESPNTKFTMRSVPHSLSMATSILAPAGNTTAFQDRTGWSGDGAPPPGRLREFLLGAIIQHFPKHSLARVAKESVPPGSPFDFRLPTDDELDLVNEFSLNAGRTNNIDLSTVSFDNSNAENGRVIFLGSACNFCHANAGANIPTGENFNFNTNVELVPNPAQGFLGINFPLDGGFLGQGLASPNRDCNGDNALDCFGDGTFNTPPLIEAADTGPFFHNNVSYTIEDAVRFYTQPPFTPVIPLTAAEIDDVAAFLRVLNASFNLNMALQRNEAVMVLIASGQDGDPAVRATANKLLELSNREIEDAIDVLTSGPLGDLSPISTIEAADAADLNIQAMFSGDQNQRMDLVSRARGLIDEANVVLGTMPQFQLGQGNLLF